MKLRVRDRRLASVVLTRPHKAGVLTFAFAVHGPPLARHVDIPDSAAAACADSLATYYARGALVPPSVAEPAPPPPRAPARRKAPAPIPETDEKPAEG